MKMTQQDWINRAGKVLPGATFGNFDKSIVIRNGLGSRVWDEDGKEYIDYLIGSGPMLLGHGNEEVLDVVQEQLGKGMTFFANNAAGIELAEHICEAVACAERVRYVASGGEADMYAIRLARAYTGRSKLLKFEGGYHGMSAEAQMSLAPVSLSDFPTPVPDSAGIPKGVRDEVLISQFNDIEMTRSLLDQFQGEIAAVIVEPLQRVISPAEGFLASLRKECTQRGVVLIFDEIVTGFRLDYGGAQERYGVTPDLCTLGKIIGGGFPLAAIAGSEEIMNHFDKEKAGGGGFLMQLGTLSGNPVAAVAGMKTMEILRREGAYEQLRKNGKQIMRAIEANLSRCGHAHQLTGDPTLFDVVFTEQPVLNYRDYIKGDKEKSDRFNLALRARGIFKSPGKFYPSLALTENDLERTVAAIKFACGKI